MSSWLSPCLTSASMTWFSIYLNEIIYRDKLYFEYTLGIEIDYNAKFKSENFSLQTLIIFLHIPLEYWTSGINIGKIVD